MEVDNIYDGRVSQIKNQLKGLGTSPYRLYTNQEVIDRLKDLQAAMARGVFEKTHAENLRDKDIMLHFKRWLKSMSFRRPIHIAALKPICGSSAIPSAPTSKECAVNEWRGNH